MGFYLYLTLMGRQSRSFWIVGEFVVYLHLNLQGYGENCHIWCRRAIV